MRKFLTVIVMIYIIASPLLSREEQDQTGNGKLSPPRGVTHAVSRRAALDQNSTGKWSVWAVKIEPGQEKVLNQGKKK